MLLHLFGPLNILCSAPVNSAWVKKFLYVRVSELHTLCKIYSALYSLRVQGFRLTHISYITLFTCKLRWKKDIFSNFRYLGSCLPTELLTDTREYKFKIYFVYFTRKNYTVIHLFLNPMVLIQFFLNALLYWLNRFHFYCC